MKSLGIDSFKQLELNFEGEIKFDSLHKAIYATDASVYRKIPLGVAFPKTKEDIKLLISFADENNITLIPRAAGTSLAGQCVGDGLVVDISKYFTQIININEQEKIAIVQPGVIRDELNDFVSDMGLFFGPNTSTSNRCTIAGMVGNNSSGTTSIKYGVTRDKVISIKALLSDGSEVEFKSIGKDEFQKKREENTLEGKVYEFIFNELIQKEVQDTINKEFPKKIIHRRNNGYAVDSLLNFKEFDGTSKEINIAELIAGSEGTLCFITEITIQLDTLPPPKRVMICAHFRSVKESMKAVVSAMKHNLYTCELMDKTILDCTKNNREQSKNRYFIEGDPETILMLEICTNSDKDSEELANKLISDLKVRKLGYAFPKLINEEINKAVNLRKAGLGLLGNIVGDDKAVACIEDTAVDVNDLPNYIEEFSKMMDDFGQNAVYYAHAGAGELHLRPILNLKKKSDVKLFREITTKTAKLVKKYGGSFSGEHGDGIVRAEFIPLMLGEKNYDLMKRLKLVFDPKNVFNKGKIVNPFPMDENLRYKVDRTEPEIETIQDFSDSLGILRAAEKCNGSGDCRKLPNAGGTMCPSYRATRNEKDTTRARANALREFLTHSDKRNKFNQKELFEVFDLCISCKACSSECPSNVDIAALKAEFLYQYYKENRIPLRTRLFAESTKWNKLGSSFPFLTNSILNTGLVKNLMGIAAERSIPKLAKQTTINWYKKHKDSFNKSGKKKSVYLFVDEFTNFYDASIGKEAIELLHKLKYKVRITNHKESGRSFISKGILGKAQEIANFNVHHFKDLVSENTPLVGIEPSAILSFRDEYLRLAEDKSSAKRIAKHTFTFEEFIAKEFDSGAISSEEFTLNSEEIKIHGHCQQKSLSSTSSIFKMLSIPKNYKVTILNTGCCGMAGSFGYEKEHYKLSMQVGEDTLFPKIRNLDKNTVISASGTSCRHQIKDGTKRESKHPISILNNAFRN